MYHVLFSGERYDHSDQENRRKLVRGYLERSYGLFPSNLCASRSAITLRRRNASRNQRPCIRSPAFTMRIIILCSE